MGIFWLFAEGLIMIYVRKGFLFLKTGNTRQRNFLLFCLTVFTLMTLLSFGKEMRMDRLFSFLDRFFGGFYYKYLWNFICALWVVIEGAIAVYVFRAYGILKDVLSPEKTAPQKYFPHGPSIFYIGFLAFYVVYHFFLFSLVDSGKLDYQTTRNILLFYARICGVFWIAIEGVIAFIAFRAYHLLKRNST